MPHHFNRRTLVFSAFALSAWPAAAQTVSVPQKSSKLRQQLLDAVRPKFIYESGGPVEFVVNRLATFDGWAFGNVSAQRPGGVPIDWTKTRYREYFADGSFDPSASFFLLRRKAGRWTVVDYVVGPGDLTWDGWRAEYGLPRRLFVAQ